jgi:hypothetical protein
MKKIITLCLFAVAMLLSNQSVVAQNSELGSNPEISKMALQKTETLSKFIQLEDSQMDSVYEVLEDYYTATLPNATNRTEVSEEVVKKSKLRLDSKMKGILTDKQFNQYTEYSKSLFD